MINRYPNGRFEVVITLLEEMRDRREGFLLDKEHLNSKPFWLLWYCSLIKFSVVLLWAVEAWGHQGKKLNSKALILFRDALCGGRRR
jgi:hypothetical protein